MPAFSTPEPITVTVEFAAGTARITASDRVDTVVDIRPTDSFQDVDVRAATLTVVEYSDGKLLVRSPGQRGGGLFGRVGSIEMTIDLPAGSNVEAAGSAAEFHTVGELGRCRVKTGRGDVSVEGVGTLDVSCGMGAIVADRVGGDATVSSGSGRVRLGELSGSAVVKNSHGDIRVGTAGGDLRASTAKGDVTVESALADVTAATSYGDVRIGEVVRGATSLKTARGEIEIGIRSGTTALLDARTAFGRVRNDLEAVGGPESDGETLRLSAHTSYGNIVIRRTQEAHVN